MKPKILAFLALVILNLTTFTVYSQKVSGKDSELYLKTMKNLVDFFDENAFDQTKMAYLSEIDNVGKTISDKVFTVALNRCIYGLSYSSKYFPNNLTRAKQSSEFLLKNLIGKDPIGKYFISYIENKIPDNSEELDIWQQAYGLNGLTELYRVTKDKELLNNIHELHIALVQRFRDKERGGFYGNYNIKTGQVAGSKSIQSLMYPITAYMSNLWLADTENRQMYESIIKEHLKILAEIAWNPKSNWVNLKFDDAYKVCVNPSTEKPCFNGSPGYNFQLASLFLRTKSWSFISEKDKGKYQKLGREIVDATLIKDIYYQNDISQGFYGEINPKTNEVLDARKSWWQHCEAIIALSMVQDKHSVEFEKLKSFFFNNFPDFQHKGEYFYLSKTNQPITGELKGAKGKSMYHTIEMIRFLMQGSTRLLNK